MIFKGKRAVISILLTLALLCGAVLPAAAVAPIDVHTPANVVRTQNKAVQGVDLIVTDIAWDNDPDNDAQVKPGTALTFRVTVKNQGSQTSGDLAVDVKANAKTVFTLQAEALEAGKSVTVTADDAWTPTAGDYMITAAVSGGTESNADNNDYTENLRVANNKLTAPKAALKRGFSKLTFSDDFNSLATIDTESTGEEGYHWYVSRPWGEPDQRLNIDYSLTNSVLTIKTANKSAWAWSLCTVDARKTSGFGFHHGYLEYSVRLPYTSDDETKLKSGVRNPGVWALATDSVWADVTGVHNTRSVEVDWLEYKGTKYKGGAQFHICLHDVLDLKGNDGGYQDHHASEGAEFYHDQGYAVGGDGKFHVFGCAWSEGILEYYLDGKLIHVKTYSEDGYPEPMASGTGSEKTGIFYPLEEQYMPIVLGAVDEFRMEVDYVRIWQSDGTVKAEPTYSRLATEFVGIHLADENGNPVKTVNQSSVDILLKAESAWKVLMQEEKDEVTKMLGVSYADLLAKAKNGVADGTYSTTVPGGTGTTAPLTEPTDTDGDGTPFELPIGWLIALGAGVLVLMAMAVVVVVLLRKRRNNTPTEQK